MATDNEQWLRNRIGQPAEQDMESVRGAQSILPHHGPHAVGDDGPLDEFRARRDQILRDHQDCAEEMGVSWAEYCRLMQEDDDRQAYLRSPEYAEKCREEEAARQRQRSEERSIDEQVAAVAMAHFGAVTPLYMDYFGHGEHQVAHVRQRIGGAPKKCRVHVASMTVGS